MKKKMFVLTTVMILLVTAMLSGCSSNANNEKIGRASCRERVL